jgi:hypothetical protein
LESALLVIPSFIQLAVAQLQNFPEAQVSSQQHNLNIEINKTDLEASFLSHFDALLLIDYYEIMFLEYVL